MNSPPSSPAPGRSAVLGLRRHPVVGRVADVASALGSPVHVVGGLVRDAWLGRTTRDVDVVVSGRGEEIARRLAELLPARFVPLGGKEFAAFRLVGEDFELDLWDREGMTVTQDLARRDLTVNALALELWSGSTHGRGGRRHRRGDPASLVDPFGGLADLERRLLRATTPESFTGDPLRVLRVPRFLSQLTGFRVEGGTRELARRAGPGLSRVAAERIREELLQIFAAEAAARGLREMERLGLYPELFLRPSGDRATEDLGEPLSADLPAREMEALPVAVERLMVLADEVGRTEVPAPDRAAGRWASALLHAASGGAAETKAAGVPVVEGLRDRGYLSRRTAEPVLALLRTPRPPAELPGATGELGELGDRERRRTLHRLGRHWPTAVAWWGAQALARGTGEQEAARPGQIGGNGTSPWESWQATARELLELIRDDGPWILDPPRLIGGDEVRELLQLPSGPELGKALERVRQAQVDGRVRTREEAVAWLTGKTPSEKSRRTISSRRP